VAAVERVLSEVDAAEVPRIDVYNKCDLLGPEELRRLKLAAPDALFLSAKTGEGREELLETVTARLSLDVVRTTLTFDPKVVESRTAVARLYRDGRVLQHVETDDHIAIEVEAPRRLIDRLPAAAITGRAS
jgi:GTPase